MRLPTASIIIRTFNEEKHLAKLLDKIKEQSFQDYELILVDSGSRDRTLEIAGKYPVKIIRIKPEEFSFGYSLNQGCRAAQGEYLVFVSAHTYPQNERWLENLLQPFCDNKIAMVYGRQIGNDVTSIAEERDIANNFGKKSKILVEESFGNNANAAIRKSLWQKISFDEQLPGLEDIDWAHKVQEKGLYVYYRADAIIVHIHDESVRQIYNRFKRESIAYRQIYPDFTYKSTKVWLNFFRILIKDLFYGLNNKRSFNKIVGAVLYRIAEFKAYDDAFNKTETVVVVSSSVNNSDINLTQPEEEIKLSFPSDNLSLVIDSANSHQLQQKMIPFVKDDDVLINVKYVGVCSTDLDIAKGNLDYYKSGWARYPIVPGHEFSGIIAGVGKMVKSFRVGDPVVGECIMGCGNCASCQQNLPLNCQERRELGVLNFDGAYANYLVIPARFVHRLLPGISLKKACLIEPLAVSLRGVNKLLAGENGNAKKAAVVGHGTIGNLCAQLLAQKGHKVTVIDSNPLRLEQIRSAGITAQSQLKGLAEYDFVVEATGKPEVLANVLNQSRTSARLLLLGLPYGQFQFNFESIVCFDKTIVGSVGSTREEFKQAINLINSLNLDSLTTSLFTLDQYKEAWQKQKNGEVIKAILAMEGKN